MKFKVGDKVRILPGAADGDGVARFAEGKTGKIIRKYPEYYLVTMDEPRINGYIDNWAVSERWLTAVTIIGQQLLFEFMQ